MEVRDWDQHLDSTVRYEDTFIHCAYTCAQSKSQDQLSQDSTLHQVSSQQETGWLVEEDLKVWIEFREINRDKE